MRSHFGRVDVTKPLLYDPQCDYLPARRRDKAAVWRIAVGSEICLLAREGQHSPDCSIVRAPKRLPTTGMSAAVNVEHFSRYLNGPY